MRLLARSLVALAAAAGIFVAAAKAETWTLELKQLESQGRGGIFSGSASDYIYRATYPQSFYAQMQPNNKTGPVLAQNSQQTEAFKKIVKKEPKYECDRPFCGVAKLGSQEYAFALDAASPTPAAKDAKPDAEKPKAEAKPESALSRLRDKLMKETTPPKSIAYNRLYFDFNHNGDLTDDKVIEAEPQQHLVFDRNLDGGPQSYAQIQFPRINVTIDADGTKLDYAFFMRGVVQGARDYSYASIQINAAAYREGEITLDGKKRHVVLIDFNSNGRFDDAIKVSTAYRSPEGQIYPEQGDMLLVDPDASNAGLASPYDVTSGSNRHYLSKLVNIDDHYYDLKVSPAGDKLTLSDSSVALGNVTNPNDGFRAVIHGDAGFLRIHGDKGTPVPVPEGQWKLLSYTIDRTGMQAPSEPAEKKAEAGKQGSLLDALAKKMETLLSGSALPGDRYRRTVVSASASDKCKAIKVVKGETVELPFGPPYKPVVTGNFFEGGTSGRQLSLGMTLVGSAGEICTNMTVDGTQPPKPKFTITDANGEVVQQGNFEYG